MKDYSAMSDDEINRAVAEAIEPRPYDSMSMEFDTRIYSREFAYWRGLFVDLWEPRPFCTDPAAWGWLMEREHLTLGHHGTETDGREVWHDNEGWWAFPRLEGINLYEKSMEENYGVLADTPGRAVAISFLVAVSESQGQPRKPTG